MSVASHQDPQELLRLAIGPACHELRSPLAVVYGFSRMLEDMKGLDATPARYASQIVKAAERLDVLLDDLSQIGRVAAGRSVPQLESVRLHALVADVAATTGNEQRLRVDPGTDVAVRVDATWLAESLRGIAEALCFEDHMGVRLSWRQEPHEVQLHLVPDSAFMIDVDPDKSALGLALARVRIVAMGGVFEGTGDRVIVTLPRG